MKKTKVIIPALGILLLSTAASVTGTVAWFATNQQVTATGMTIKAMTDSNFLAISKTSSLSEHLATVDLATPSGEVLPTNWVNDSGWKWVSAVGTASDNGAKTGDYSPLTLTESGNFGQSASPVKNYYVYDSVYVGLLGESTTAGDYELKCNVKFTPKVESNLNACLTLGLDVGADRTADFDERYVLDSTAAAATTKNGVNALIDGADLPTDGTGTQIKIYVFFNGDHAACTSANAINLDDITIDLEFNLLEK